MDLKSKKSIKLQTIKGLLLRIIIACIIFILLFLGRLFSVEVFQYNTDSIIEQLQNNEWIERLEEKIIN